MKKPSVKSKKTSPLIFLKMAMLSIKRHPIRSGLALLGIVIGIASMTITMAIGEGANERLKKEIMGMGENSIIIVPGNYMTKGEARRSKKREKNLQYEDYQAIDKLIPNIRAISPGIESKEIAKYKENQVVVEVQGVTADYFKIESRQIAKGIAFTSYHDQLEAQVAILGSEVAKELFHEKDPIGKIILIAKRPFQILGVFDDLPKKMNRPHNPNLDIIVPFNSVWQKLIEPNSNNSLHKILVLPKEGHNFTKLVSGIRRLLRFNHQLAEGDSDDFTIWDLQAIMDAIQKSSQLFNQFLLIAASVSLIVGGVGIMNIMLVAMTERKKEIGIKMAIGATSFQILIQFLIESVLLCLVGGFVGIISGVAGSYLLSSFTEFQGIINEKPIILALMTTLSVGLFFGFYPAFKASKVQPVEALQTI